MHPAPTRIPCNAAVRLLRRQRTHWAFAICTLFLSVNVQAQDLDQGPSAVTTARNTLDKWVETRQLISATKSEWAEGKTLLESRIAMLNREIDSVQGRISEAEGDIAETDKKLTGLAGERENLKKAASALAGMVGKLEESTRNLLTRLPQPLVERVKPLSQGIPTDSKDNSIGLSRRFQNIIGILDAINKFNREVTATSEVRQLSDGTTAEVTVLYLGIGMAFYASGDGSQGGIGSPGPDGWSWEPTGSSASIAEAVAIHNNEAPAAYVQVPIHIN